MKGPVLTNDNGQTEARTLHQRPAWRAGNTEPCFPTDRSTLEIQTQPPRTGHGTPKDKDEVSTAQ